MAPLTWSTDVAAASASIDVRGRPDPRSVSALCDYVRTVADGRTDEVRLRFGPQLGGARTAGIVDTLVDRAAAGICFFVTGNDRPASGGWSEPAWRLPGASRRVLSASPPPRPMVSSDLLPLPGVARHCRDVLTAACLRWDLSHRVGPACLVATELVNDSVRRFSGPSTLTALHDQGLLYVAVRRGTSGPESDDGSTDMGFLVIHAVTACWGVFGHGDDVITWGALATGA